MRREAFDSLQSAQRCVVCGAHRHDMRCTPHTGELPGTPRRLEDTLIKGGRGVGEEWSERLLTYLKENILQNNRHCRLR